MRQGALGFGSSSAATIRVNGSRTSKFWVNAESSGHATGQPPRVFTVPHQSGAGAPYVGMVRGSKTFAETRPPGWASFVQALARQGQNECLKYLAATKQLTKLRLASVPATERGVEELRGGL